MSTMLPSIAIVDDHSELLSALARVIRSDYRVVCYSRAQDLLEVVIIGVRYDVVLTDIEMPDLDGVGLYRELCSLAPELAARVVFMTSLDDVEKSRAISGTGRPLLMKPFGRAELLATLVGARANATTSTQPEGRGR